MIVGNLRELLGDIQAGNGYAVSDGSFQESQGTATWIIEGTTNTNRLIGQEISPSNEAGHSSFCSKLTGIHVILLTVSIILLTTGKKRRFELHAVANQSCNDYSKSKQPIPMNHTLTSSHPPDT